MKYWNKLITFSILSRNLVNNFNHTNVKNENLFNTPNDLFGSNKAIPQKNNQSSTSVPFEVELFISSYLLKNIKFAIFSRF